MIGSTNREVLENLGPISVSMTGLMGITPELIDQAPRRVSYPMHVGKQGRSVSIHVVNGVPVDTAGDVIAGRVATDIEELKAFDDPLVEADLGYLASYEAQRVIRIGSAEGNMWGPHQPQRANLTGGFIRSIGAIRNIALWLPERAMADKNQRQLARMARKATETLVTVVLYHPEKMFLPADTINREQADALEALLPALGGARNRELRKDVQEATKDKHGLPNGNPVVWTEDLRVSHLAWRTSEEYQEARQGMRRLFEQASLPDDGFEPQG